MKNALRTILAGLLLAAASLVAPLGAWAQTGYTLAPSSYTFPAGVVGTAEAGTLVSTFTNTSAVTISSISVSVGGTNSADFGVVTSPVTNCGGSLAAGASCTLTTTFTPGGAGNRTALVTISWSGNSYSPAYLYLAGSGGLNPTAYNTVVGVTPPAATLALTGASCNSVISMGATTGEVVTLPPPIVGCFFDFVITVSNTSNSNEIRTDSSSHFLLGAVGHSATGIAPLNFWADGSSIQAIKMDGAHLGGLIGSSFHVLGISSTQWEITGHNECTATCTTAFTATP